MKQNFYRYPWEQFPDVILHADEKTVKNHESYHAAKTGDPEEAFRLVQCLLNSACLEKLKCVVATRPIIFVSAHALEKEGVNAIPEAMAELIGNQLDREVEHQIVQTNIVSHTKADGFSRLARQAEFNGKVIPNRIYFLVDDFVGQGGTLANLRGWIMKCGGRVAGATVLTGKSYSTKLAIDLTQIDELNSKHGRKLREWWIDMFGFDYDCLTFSEARYLIRTPTFKRIRDCIIEALEEGDRSEG